MNKPREVRLELGSEGGTIVVSNCDKRWTPAEYEYELSCIQKGKGIWTVDELNEQVMLPDGI